MSERTALEIADKLDYLTRSVMSIHNIPTLPKLCDCGEKAADMLRQQHAEIADLQRLQCDCVEEKLHHQWDGDGERCERCGDKDWFAGPECKPAVKGHACRQEDRAMLATPAGQELVACAIKDLEVIEDNGLFRASAKRSTREWSKEESVEWALGLESGNLTEKARHARIAHLSDNEIESTAAEYIYEEDGWNRDRYYHGLNLIAFANAIGHLSVRAFLSLSGQYVTNDASRDAAIAAAVAVKRKACGMKD